MQQRHLTRRALLTGAAALGTAGVALAACSIPLVVPPRSATPTPSPPTPLSPSVARTATPTTGGTLRIGRLEDISLAGIPHLLAPANFQVSNLIYDTLIEYDDQLVPRPRLATNWDWSPDYLQLNLQLRSDVRFHTGRAFTSEDAKFNLERLRDPAVGSQFRNYASSMLVTAPAPDRLQVNFNAPLRSSFDAITLTFMADPETIEQSRTGQRFVGTGPYTFQEWVQGDRLMVRRNLDYWQSGKPFLDSVELRVFQNQPQALIALESQAIDWMVGVAAADARRLQADPAYTVLETGKGASYLYLGLDVTTPGLDNKLVRQALGFAINRQRIVDSVLSGFGRAASTPWPVGSPAYDAAADGTFTFDLARAQQLLATAGWVAEAPIPLFVSEALPATIQMAQVIQADLASIGVTFAIQTLSQADFVSRLTKAQFQGAWITGIAWMNFSPATFFNAAFPVRIPNSSNFDSPTYRSLIDRLSAATDDTLQRGAVDQLTGMLLDEAFVLTIAESTLQQSGAEVVRSSVKNINVDRFRLVDYQDLWITP
jgi:peptide/nickel transport system substrate-binding protein